MKKFVAMVLALVMVCALLLGLAGCVKTVTLQCDGCGKSVTTDKTQMDDSWIVFCADCQKDLDID